MLGEQALELGRRQPRKAFERGALGLDRQCLGRSVEDVPGGGPRDIEEMIAKCSRS